jgi:hypothetical protein
MGLLGNENMSADLLKLQFQNAAEFAESKGDSSRAQFFTRLAQTSDSVDTSLLGAWAELYEDLRDQEADNELMAKVGRGWFPQSATEYVKEFISRRTGGA